MKININVSGSNIIIEGGDAITYELGDVVANHINTPITGIEIIIEKKDYAVPKGPNKEMFHHHWKLLGYELNNLGIEYDQKKKVPISITYE